MKSLFRVSVPGRLAGLRRVSIRPDTANFIPYPPANVLLHPTARVYRWHRLGALAAALSLTLSLCAAVLIALQQLGGAHAAAPALALAALASSAASCALHVPSLLAGQRRLLDRTALLCGAIAAAIALVPHAGEVAAAGEGLLYWALALMLVAAAPAATPTGRAAALRRDLALALAGAAGIGAAVGLVLEIGGTLGAISGLIVALLAVSHYCATKAIAHGYAPR